MKKADYITALANETGFTKKAIEEFLRAQSAVVAANLATDEVPLIDGLKLTFAKKNARVCRNPQTGESIEVPAKVVPKAKFGKTIKDIFA